MAFRADEMKRNAMVVSVFTVITILHPARI